MNNSQERKSWLPPDHDLELAKRQARGSVPLVSAYERENERLRRENQWLTYALIQVLKERESLEIPDILRLSSWPEDPDFVLLTFRDNVKRATILAACPLSGMTVVIGEHPTEATEKGAKQ